MSCSIGLKAACWCLNDGALQLFNMPIAISVLMAAITLSFSLAVLLRVAHEVTAAGVVTAFEVINPLIAVFAFRFAGKAGKAGVHDAQVASGF